MPLDSDTLNEDGKYGTNDLGREQGLVDEVKKYIKERKKKSSKSKTKRKQKGCGCK